MDEGVKRTQTLDLNKSCDDAESNIKVRVQKMRSSLKTDLDAAGQALMARVRSNSRILDRSRSGSGNRQCWDKHHANCTGDSQ
jgi:hypothetical protein